MEHLRHFGLTRDPFVNDPQVQLYFASDPHANAERRLLRGVSQAKGLCIFTGAEGTGKTMVVRHLLEGLEEEIYEACLLVPVVGISDGDWVLTRFARTLGVEEPASDRSEVLGQIYEQLAIVREEGRSTVLIIDEAQVLMDNNALAELRGLLNLEYEERRLLTLVLVGLPSLEPAIAETGLAARVDVNCRLAPMDPETSVQYLTHRIRNAAGNPAILESSALAALIELAGGAPRRLNTLADNALYEAWSAGRPAATDADVRRAAADLNFGAPAAPASVSPLAAAASGPGSPLAATTSGAASLPAAHTAVAPERALAPEPAVAPEPPAVEEPWAVGPELSAAEPEPWAAAPELPDAEEPWAVAPEPQAAASPAGQTRPAAPLPPPAAAPAAPPPTLAPAPTPNLVPEPVAERPLPRAAAPLAASRETAPPAARPAPSPALEPSVPQAAAPQPPAPRPQPIAASPVAPAPASPAPQAARPAAAPAVAPAAAPPQPAAPPGPHGPRPGDTLADALLEFDDTRSAAPQPVRPSAGRAANPAAPPAAPSGPANELVGFADFVEVTPSAAAAPVATAVPADGPPKHEDELDDVFVELIEE